MADGTTSEKAAPQSCLASCGRLALEHQHLCDDCFSEWLASEECYRAKQVEYALADVAFMDFCQRRTAERRNEVGHG